MELEITWGRALRVWWALFWRQLVAILFAMITGGVVGFAVGFLMGAAGFSLPTIQLVAQILGFLLGTGISIFPLRMILGKDFGEFRLVLVETEMSYESQTSEPQRRDH